MNLNVRPRLWVVLALIAILVSTFFVELTPRGLSTLAVFVISLLGIGTTIWPITNNAWKVIFFALFAVLLGLAWYASEIQSDLDKVDSEYESLRKEWQHHKEERQFEQNLADLKEQLSKEREDRRRYQEQLAIAAEELSNVRSDIQSIPSETVTQITKSQ